MASFTPTTVMWTSNAFDFLYVYDWDTVAIDETSSSMLGWQIELCVGNFPCFLKIDGRGNNIRHYGQGALSCWARDGCTGISVQAVHFVCDNTTISVPIFKVYQSVFSITNSSFQNCMSTVDGGIIQSYDQASVFISSSNFENIHTLKSGGVIAVAGSKIYIRDSTFVNCSSDESGGAIFASTFQSSGSEQAVDTVVNIISSTFRDCKSAISGGAIYSISQDVDMPYQILINSSSTLFISCESFVGGAIYGSGMYVTVNLINSTVKDSKAIDAGGAISIIDSAVVVLANSSLRSNSAVGRGGGAVHLRNSRFFQSGLVCTDNVAPAGGGGGLLWEGNILLGQISNGICAAGNAALYGSCLASDYKLLEISSSVPDNKPVFPGLPFPIAVIKKDFYGQVIASDDSSLIRVFVSSESSSPAATGTGTNTSSSLASAALEGPIAAAMNGGHASFSIAINPVFSKVSGRKGLAVLQSQPRIYFQGFDGELNQVMKSSVYPVSITSGKEVCPSGYVLQLSQDSAIGGTGSCRFCGPGTYSIEPLATAPGSLSDTPSCIDCPAGGICEKGGMDIRFSVGTWAVRNGMYVLLHCPAGYQLVNSTSGTSSGVFSHSQQKCKACLPGQYILDPDRYSCQNCPAGHM